jgi:hypothetical protein
MSSRALVGTNGVRILVRLVEEGSGGVSSGYIDDLLGGGVLVS